MQTSITRNTNRFQFLLLCEIYSVTRALKTSIKRSSCINKDPNFPDISGIPDILKNSHIPDYVYTD